ncbi:hypothetical protein LJ656_09435 [Paraburkholderia sp. MMS20-SJTR3]|uniref:Uncharacterized protein n=1 Tax=Paraburkholderia sejongensis TaxID=2886946 RepID=A0ABS8JSC9_9BURK|nr:hypothetical protein [Paraburkholderia sp. MMS20-SJTR3]MCC8392810.1 hypothetical protein [Paraburkholderia sp. MMS20-SJTR3]
MTNKSIDHLLKTRFPFCRAAALAIMEKNRSTDVPRDIDTLVDELVDSVESLPIVSADYFPVYLKTPRNVISKISVDRREKVFLDYRLAHSANASKHSSV